MHQVTDREEPEDLGGPVEAAVRTGIAEFADETEEGELTGVQRAMAETAYVLAKALDKGAGLAVAGVARELTRTLQVLTEGPDDDDAGAALLARLSTPVGDSPQE